MSKFLVALIEYPILLPIALVFGILWCGILLIPCEVIGFLIWLSDRRGYSHEPNLFPCIPFVILACIYDRYRPHHYAIWVDVKGIISGWVKLQRDDPNMTDEELANVSIIQRFNSYGNVTTFRKYSRAQLFRDRLDALFSHAHERSFEIKVIK